MSFAIEKIERYGLLKSGFRNIRSRIDGISAEFDLIPEVSVPVGDDDPGIAGLPHPLVANLMRGASRLIEGEAALRITFSYLMAVAVDTDIDVDLFGGLHERWSSAPKIDGSSSYYPLLEIRGSPWKAQLPDWRRRDDPLIRHIRMISAECSFDVLGDLSGGVWVSNTGT